MKIYLKIYTSVEVTEEGDGEQWGNRGRTYETLNNVRAFISKAKNAYSNDYDDITWSADVGDTLYVVFETYDSYDTFGGDDHRHDFRGIYPSQHHAEYAIKRLRNNHNGWGDSHVGYHIEPAILEKELKK